MTKADIVIVGAGIIGATTAWKLSLRYPTKKILVIEKEASCALHQTGRNSGVIHAGVYYEPGSLKARYCRKGLKSTIEFAKKYHIPYQQCGKLIVATNQLEEQRMEALYQRSRQNELDTHLVSAEKLRDLEPNITGQGAILVKDTGIVDYPGITKTMLALFIDNGGELALSQQVSDISEEEGGVLVKTETMTVRCGLLINCAGLMSDRLIAMQGLEKDFQIIPFRGEYFKLPQKYNDIVNHLIYPVPDPQMPFLGVHLTKMIDGSVTVGPNAVLAFAREGYQKMDFSFDDTSEILTYSGFWPLVKNHFKSGLQETKNSLFKSGYLKLVKKYCPQIEICDLQPHPSGIRAQAVTLDGKLMHDFCFVESDFTLHVGNAPSPAATSAIPIAEAIIEKVVNRLA